MDQQRFGGVAGTGLFGFGIEENLFGHGQIGSGIDKDVANPVVMFDDGHPGEAHHGFDEAFAAARDDEVEILVHLRHVLHAFAVGKRHQLDAVGRQTGRFAPGLEGGCDGGVAMKSLAATPQDGGIAALEAEHRGVAGDIGAAFVDDADDPDGHADLAHFQTVGAFPGREFLPHGVRQAHHLPHALRHGGDPGGIQHQTVQHGGAEALGLSGFEVPGVGR